MVSQRARRRRLRARGAGWARRGAGGRGAGRRPTRAVLTRTRTRRVTRHATPASAALLSGAPPICPSSSILSTTFIDAAKRWYDTLDGAARRRLVG